MKLARPGAALAALSFLLSGATAGFAQIGAVVPLTLPERDWIGLIDLSGSGAFADTVAFAEEIEGVKKKHGLASWLRVEIAPDGTVLACEDAFAGKIENPDPTAAPLLCDAAMHTLHWAFIPGFELPGKSGWLTIGINRDGGGPGRRRSSSFARRTVTIDRRSTPSLPPRSECYNTTTATSHFRSKNRTIPVSP